MARLYIFCQIGLVYRQPDVKINLKSALGTFKLSFIANLAPIKEDISVLVSGTVDDVVHDC